MSGHGLLRRVLLAAARRRRLIRNAAWVGAVSGLALVAAGVAAGGGPFSAACVADPLPLASPGAADGKRAVLTAPGSGFRLRFDDARDVRADVVVLADPRRDVKLAPGDRVWAAMSGYLRSSDRNIVPRRNGSGRTSPWVEILRITPAGKVEVCVEVDAGVIGGAHPGQYSGTVSVSGEDLEVESTIPVLVTFRSSRWLAFALAGLGVVAGLLVKMFTELAAAHRSPNAAAPRSVRAYVREWSFAIAVFVGVGTGALGYVEIYDANPVWGASAFDWLKLVGTCFGFQLGGIGGIDLARRFVGDLPAVPQPAPAS